MATAPRQPLSAANRLKKLRTMSTGELWSRLSYATYCHIERHQHGRVALPPFRGLRDALVPELRRAHDWRGALLATRRASGTRFFTGVEECFRTRELIVGQYPTAHALARVHADRALRHEFSFFGETFCYGEQVDWHADPVTRARWPKVYHRDVPVHGGNVGFGDVKHVWELCRHQFLIDLAKAWALDRTPQHAAAVRSLVFDWRAQNPLGTGVAWACALEPAFRVLSWLWAYHLTADDPDFGAEAHLEWLTGFYEHGWFLYRHLEYYTSPFNHLVGEACALYAIGVLFPQLAEAARWRALGRRVLEDALPAQFYEDGGSVEQSTFYHHATTGFYLLAALLGRQNGEELSPAVWRAIEKGIEFSALLQQPDGSTPQIGGADDGKPIRLEQLRLWDFRPYQAIGAVLFGRADFKATATRFFEDAVWLLGAAGAARFDALPALPPSPASRVLPASGYVVLRSGWSDDADYVCFDCGEQAAGLRRDAVPSAAHGHADGLSVIVWRRGRPVLVDPGFHCYNGPKPWQDHFRETAAHNTVRVDGRDQALHISKMAWSNTYTATLEAHHATSSEPWVVGSHDGYRALPAGGIIHRRAVWARQRGYLVICDVIEGVGIHDVELTFQFAPGRLEVCGDTAIFDGHVNLHWFGPVAMSPHVREGEDSPDGGWVAPSLGVKAAAPRLVLSGRMTAPATIVTIIADRHPSPRHVYRSRSGTHRPIVVSGKDWTDWIGAAGLPGSELSADHANALVSAWRVGPDGAHDDGRIEIGAPR